MVNAVILDDDEKIRESIEGYLRDFAKENRQAFEIKTYSDPVDFLEKYDASADILFTDIEMPNIDGMRVARKVRERDKDVVIVFVTNFAQYAINGYEVGAFDFILKPIRYTSFVMTLERIMNILSHRKKDCFVNLYVKEGMTRIAVSDILYVEVVNHDLIIHTAQGEEIKIRRTLASFAEQLKEQYFALCNSCYLVNIKHVRKIDKDSVTVGDASLKISQPKRKAFLGEVAKYFGGSV